MLISMNPTFRYLCALILQGHCLCILGLLLTKMIVFETNTNKPEPFFSSIAEWQSCCQMFLQPRYKAVGDMAGYARLASVTIPSVQPTSSLQLCWFQNVNAEFKYIKIIGWSWKLCWPGQTGAKIISRWVAGGYLSLALLNSWRDGWVVSEWKCIGLHVDLEDLKGDTGHCRLILTPKEFLTYNGFGGRICTGFGYCTPSTDTG